MTNFIEIKNANDELTLVNINHIISVKEWEDGTCTIILVGGENISEIPLTIKEIKRMLTKVSGIKSF